MKKAAAVFVKTLINHNVNRFFCVPGESYLPVMDELIGSKEIDVVSCRHEGGAGFSTRPVVGLWNYSLKKYISGISSAGVKQLTSTISRPSGCV